jgi:hypothetical protein
MNKVHFTALTLYQLQQLAHVTSHTHFPKENPNAK